jgi:hypothetical protein
MKRKINTTMDDLMMAFDMNPDEHLQYLNLETGGIAIISEFFDSFDEEGNAIYEEEEKQRYCDDDKYIYIPVVESSDAFREMEEFIESKVKDKSLRSQLWDALDRRRPFRRFKDVLMEYPAAEKQWFAFQEECTKRRILEWLAENNLELADH